MMLMNYYIFVFEDRPFRNSVWTDDKDAFLETNAAVAYLTLIGQDWGFVMAEVNASVATLVSTDLKNDQVQIKK